MSWFGFGTAEPVDTRTPEEIESERRATAEKARGELRAMAQQAGMTDVSDKTLSRYLTARNNDTKESWKMLDESVKWRKQFFDGEIKVEHIINEALVGRGYFCGVDLQGCPIIVVELRYHNGSASNIPALSELFVAYLEIAEKVLDAEGMSESETGFTVIVDFRGISLGNSDIPLSKAAFGIMNNYYPERLKQCIMLNPPWLFWGIWKVIKAFMDERTINKFVWLEDNWRNDLRKYVAADQLPSSYGGSYTSEFDPYINGIMLHDGKGNPGVLPTELLPANHPLRASAPPDNIVSHEGDPAPPGGAAAVASAPAPAAAAAPAPAE
eukprot:TRINITY_DN6103_c0_g1_i1.p1 TRINITY_DN6103_c0_g1~~TRINITY_DN6103_c0_g1_i1.p1  ORF type:complete len:325 (-),score=58.18 TRINITY_DN6103_c0_g1_i1:107-1081(-)